MKHMNKKLALNSVKEVITEQVVVPKCTLCDDNFNTLKDDDEHKQEHIKGEAAKMRRPETWKCSKSKMCIAKKLKLHQPVYLIR